MIQLKAGALRCELVPELGGCVAGLWLGRRRGPEPTAVLEAPL